MQYCIHCPLPNTTHHGVRYWACLCHVVCSSWTTIDFWHSRAIHQHSMHCCSLYCWELYNKVHAFKRFIKRIFHARFIAVSTNTWILEHMVYNRLFNTPRHFDLLYKLADGTVGLRYDVGMLYWTGVRLWGSFPTINIMLYSEDHIQLFTF